MAKSFVDNKILGKQGILYKSYNNKLCKLRINLKRKIEK